MSKKSFFYVLGVIVWCSLVLWAAMYPLPTHNREENNPFVIGQTVYPVADFELTGASDEFLALANKGAQVINETSNLIRVRFIDGSENVYSWKWFKSGEFELTDEWVMGNPFVTGQEICAIPSSVREDFPDKGIVTGISGSLLTLEGYPSQISSGHFQVCR